MHVQYITLWSDSNVLAWCFMFEVPCWKPSRWQSDGFSVSLVVPDTSPAHLKSLWPAAGAAPLQQINTARHYGMDSTHSQTVQMSKSVSKWNFKWAVNLLFMFENSWSWINVRHLILFFIYLILYVSLIVWISSTSFQLAAPRAATTVKFCLHITASVIII